MIENRLRIRLAYPDQVFAGVNSVHFAVLSLHKLNSVLGWLFAILVAFVSFYPRPESPFFRPLSAICHLRFAICMASKSDKKIAIPTARTHVTKGLGK